MIEIIVCVCIFLGGIVTGVIGDRLLPPKQVNNYQTINNNTEVTTTTDSKQVSIQGQFVVVDTKTNINFTMNEVTNMMLVIYTNSNSISITN